MKTEKIIENQFIIEKIRNRTVEQWRPPLLHPCWNWTGAVRDKKKDYGSIQIKGKALYTHRAMWIATNGPIDIGKELDHVCRNKKCCNPVHLEPVSHLENVRRGVSSQVNGARQREKKLCPSGHSYDEGNVIIDKNGYRKCRTCCRIRDRVRSKRPDRIISHKICRSNRLAKLKIARERND